MTVYMPVCTDCKYFHADNDQGLTCDAFPYGIPMKIVTGEDKHAKPLPGQKNNIVFKRGRQGGGIIL